MVTISNLRQKAKVKYIAVFEDVGGDEVHGIQQTKWILDAIPTSEVDEIIAASSNPNRQEDPRVSFLMLSVPDQGDLTRTLADQEGHVLVTISTENYRSGDIRAYAPTTDQDGDGIPFFIRIHGVPDPAHIRALEIFSSFKKIQDIDDLAALPLSSNAPAAVAVYDVGQGSLSAVIDKFEHPVMFFDLGWPLSFFPNSLPKNQAHFNPFPVWRHSIGTPVVLSHLDWDHWAYVLKKGRAVWDKAKGLWKTEPEYRTETLDRPWLMRRPQFKRHGLGGSHIHFVQTLADTLHRSNPALHFWPETHRKIRFKGCLIFSCKPTRGKKKTSYLRNNEGLGMLVEDVHSHARVLLPADADYPSIPAFAKRNLTGLVAPHHGGAITPDSTPSAVGHGRMVMSVYPGSYSNMPHPNVIAEAQNCGWNIAMTSERTSCFRLGRNLSCGNRLIRLSSTPMCRCNTIPKNCLCVSRQY